MGLLSDFVEAAKEAAVDLGMNEEKVKVRHVETSKIGLDYSALLYEGVKGFNFHLRTITEDKDPTSGEMRASLSVSFDEAVAPYVFHENIDYIKGHPAFLSRWVSWAIFNFRQEHQKANLQSLFHNMDIRVYGIPGYCSPAEEEADLLFHGVLAIQKDKVLVYKFRHISRENYLCRNFSYAVHVGPEMGHSFWVVFPDNCGLDGGGSYASYRHFERLIEMVSQKLDVEVRKYDVKYEDLEKFLLRNATGFFSVLRESTLEPLHLFSKPLRILEESEVQFEKFMGRLAEEDYSQALRDLRALVQQAQENVAKFKNLDYSVIPEPNINKLASFLVGKKQLDGRLLPWFNAFTSIANIASHKDFPSKKDMQNETTRSRVLLTLYLGLQLLEELNAVVYPRLSLTSFSVS